jgi:hypothetical protein
MLSLTAYQEVMADCDELTLLAKRVPYVVMANATDVNETQRSIAEMKAQAAEIEVELGILLSELEIRTHVAALNALPTRDVLKTYANTTFNLFTPARRPSESWRRPS